MVAIAACTQAPRTTPRAAPPPSGFGVTTTTSAPEPFSARSRNTRAICSVTATPRRSSCCAATTSCAAFRSARTKPTRITPRTRRQRLPSRRTSRCGHGNGWPGQLFDDRDPRDRVVPHRARANLLDGVLAARRAARQLRFGQRPRRIRRHLRRSAAGDERGHVEVSPTLPATRAMIYANDTRIEVPLSLDRTHDAHVTAAVTCRSCCLRDGH